MKPNLKFLSRNKLYTAIEAAGLIISFSVFIILMSQVWYDVTYDRSFSGSERVYLFERPQSRIGVQAPYQRLMNRPQIQSIKDSSPDVEAVGTMGETIIMDTESNEPVDYIRAALVDDDFIRIFPFHTLAGTLSGFDRPESAFVTESAANVLFGGIGSALGRQLTMGGEHGLQGFTVIGVIKDFPVNSSLANLGVVGQMGNLNIDANNPNYESLEAFVKLRKGASPKEAASVMAKAFEKNLVLWEGPDTTPGIRELILNGSRLFTLHSSHYDPFANGTGSRTRDAVLSAIALVFLLVGLLNVFNLSNAEIPFKLLGDSVRRIFGAGKADLLRRDTVKASLLCIVSFGIALVVTVLVANSPMASLLTVPLQLGKLLPVLALCLAVALAGSLLAVYIPSIYGNTFPLAAALKGNVSLYGRGKDFRTGTLALQYLLSFLFIIVGLMIGVQNRYVSDFDLGFQTKDIVNANMGFEAAGKRETVEQELLREADIEGMAFADRSILMKNPRFLTRESNGVTARFLGMDVSANYLDLLGFEIIDGRGFNKDDGEASTGSFVVNEAFIRAYPDISVGSSMKGIRASCPDTDARIIGVVKDFNYQDLTHPIEPFAFYCSGEPAAGNLTPRYFWAAVKTVPGKGGEVAGKLPGILNKIGGGRSARSTLLESSAREFYNGNVAENILVRVSAALSLVLALLGIFGLTCTEIQAIRKGIAIRKVMGAMPKDLTWMMLRKYIMLGSAVFVAAIPLSIWVIRMWLEQFSEKASMPAWIFLLAWMLVVGTTVAVISSLALYVTRTNPAVELKKE